VEEDELVGPLGVVASRELGGVAGIPEVGEARPLHDPAGIDVEARHDALRERRRRERNRRRVPCVTEPAVCGLHPRTTSDRCSVPAYSALPTTTASSPRSRSAWTSSALRTPPLAITGR